MAGKRNQMMVRSRLGNEVHEDDIEAIGRTNKIKDLLSGGAIHCFHGLVISNYNIVGHTTLANSASWAPLQNCSRPLHHFR